MNPRWQGPGLMVAWGLTTGSWTPAELAQKCADNNIRNLCYQVIPENDAYGPALHDECRARQIHFGGWTNVPQQVTSDQAMGDLLLRLQVYGCGFFAANVEERWAYGGTVINADGTIPGKTANLCHYEFARRFRQHYPLKPACVQTNFGGFEARNPDGTVAPGYDRGAQAIYTAKRFDCQHEDYMVDSANLTPAAGDFTADNQWGLQFPGPSSSLIGCYHGWGIDQYRQPLLDSGRSRVQWIYLQEELPEDDWPRVAVPL